MQHLYGAREVSFGTRGRQTFRSETAREHRLVRSVD